MSQQCRNISTIAGLLAYAYVTVYLWFPTTEQLSTGYSNIKTELSDVSPSADFVNLGLSHFAIIQAQQREYHSEQEYQITAIILHKK